MLWFPSYQFCLQLQQLLFSVQNLLETQFVVKFQQQTADRSSYWLVNTGEQRVRYFSQEETKAKLKQQWILSYFDLF